ncbi:hypothetical protein JCM10908_001464 [Rhodotorula pacifica]|uniref:uncharacterized protein n=1 Tax=Rhodotorula pacifica TaxID=1495444 RepID=UPI00317F9AC6
MPKAARTANSAIPHRSAKHVRWSSHQSTTPSTSTLSEPRHAVIEDRSHGDQGLVEDVRHTTKQPRLKATATTAADWIPASLLAYDRPSSRWTPLDPSSLPLRSPALARVRLLTYNTFSCDPLHTASQTRALLAVLGKARADIVALQEVSEGFYRALQKWAHSPASSVGASHDRKKERGEWVMTSLEQAWSVQGPEAPKGPRRKKGQREACVLLLRKGVLARGSEVRMVKLEKARDEGGKAAIGLRVVSEGKEVLRLVTSHFSALPQNASLRARQYRSCLSFLSSPSTTTTIATIAPICIFMGDTNASAPAELEPLSEGPIPLVDAITLVSPSASSRDPPPRHQNGSTLPHAHPPVQPLSITESEASFRARPTFGHLYPYVHASARGRPRKVRRIDRVYIGTASTGSSGTSAAGGGGAGAIASLRKNGNHALAFPSTEDCATFTDTTRTLYVIEYAHLGGEPLEGKQERDRLGKGGKRYASDHEAVLVELQLQQGGLG